MGLHKNLCVNVHSTLFVTAKNWKQLKCLSIGEWINKNMVHPHNGILSNKREQATDTCNNLDESQIHYANRKEPGPKGYTLYDSIYTALSKI